MEPIRELIAVDLEMTGLQVNRPDPGDWCGASGGRTVARHVSDICESASQD